ncbi:glycosyltransferase family 2 protein [Brevundimonas diminuta]|uniref:glycosyltransferase family 2 protein n=1 Tax=Brevundimonas diminuta TaxID=293 RepID=UPI00320B3490
MTAGTAADTDALAWDVEDVRNLYRFALRREAESEETVLEMQTWSPDRLVQTFFSSPEFLDPLRTAQQSGERPWGGAGSIPDVELRRWAAARLPLTEEGRRAVCNAPPSWARIYWLLFSDAHFTKLVSVDLIGGPAQLTRLEADAVIDGCVEQVDGHLIRGWAVRLDHLDEPTQVEVWADGAFYQSVTADLFRRDIQDRFGAGGGRAGFQFHLPDDVTRGRGGLIDIRVMGVVLGRVHLQRNEPLLDDMAAAARELSEVRALLERLEARMPWVEAGVAQPLSNYEAYAPSWRDTGMDAPPSSLRSLVVIDAVGASGRELDDTLCSLLAQTSSLERLSVALVVAEGQAALAEDMRNRCNWQGLNGVSVHLVTEPALARRLMAAIEQVGERGDLCLLLRAGDELAPGALRRICARMDRNPRIQAVYFDEDRFLDGEQDKDPALRRRVDPCFKPGFDRDLLLQTPYVGQCAAVRTEVLRAHGLNDAAGEEAVGELMLRLSAADGVIDHVARVLLTRWSHEPSSELWRQAVQAHARADGAQVVAYEDELGVRLPGAVRIRRRPEASKACIIIATKDALNLLRPCVDSLLAARKTNITPFELLIIDHQSEAPETRAYLTELEASGYARIMPYEGEFNWALMNNLAAAQTDADVLVFLNNDTVVRTPDWLDELVSQAQRPEVGVVGCRLLYEDGTIQHAGFVAREEVSSFLIHDGVGDSGDDGGYLGRHALQHACVAVTGACIAIRADVFRSLGGFDSASFPVEGNDVDLCLRAQAEGLKVLYDPYATLYHLESKSRGFNTDATRRARAETASRLLWNRWGARFGRDPGFNAHFDRLSRPFSRLRPPPNWAG